MSNATGESSTAAHAGGPSNSKSSGIAPVVEPGQDFTELVTIQEIGIVGRQMKADPIGAIEGGTWQRWEAMARLGWILERRRDPEANLDRWLEQPLPALLDALGVDPAEDETEEARALKAQAAAEDPTAPASEQ